MGYKNNCKNHVLVLNNESYYCFATSVALRKAGYKTTETLNSEEALGWVLNAADSGNKDSVDLVVFYLKKPYSLEDLDNLLDILRKKNARVPVLAISDFFEGKLSQELLKDNAVNFLITPFSPDELVSRVNHILENRRTV